MRLLCRDAAVASLCLLSLVNRSLAQQPPPTSLRPVVVSAQRGTELDAREAPVSVTVIGRETIETSPATTTDELLRGIAGVQLPALNSAQNFPANPSVALRGLGVGDNATRTLVLVDGVPMNSPMFGSVYWNRIPKQNIERIEIVRGGSSSSYGSFGIGGVINIVTRAPAGSEGTAETRAGSNGTYQANLYFSRKVADRIAASADVDYFNTNGYILVVPEQRGQIDDAAGAHAFNAAGTVSFNPTGTTHGFARAGFLTEEHTAGTRLSDNTTRLFSLATGMTRVFASGPVLDVSGFYLDERFTTDNTSGRPFGSRDDEFVSNAHTTPSRDLGLSGLLRHHVSDIVPNLAAGIDVRLLDGSDRANIFDATGARVMERLGEGRQSAAGAFGEITVKPFDRLSVDASVRDDGFRTSDGRVVEGGNEIRYDDHSFAAVSYRVAGRVRADGGVAFRAAASRSFRAPTLAELYRTFGTSTFIGLSNPDLDAERATAAELGVDIARGPAFAQVTGFTTTVKDAIGGIFVSDDPFTQKNANIGALRSTGVEAAVALEISPHLRLDANYTFTNAKVTENDDDPTLVGNRGEGVAKHAIAGSATYRAGRFGATLRARYYSDQFEDITNESHLPPYAVTDVLGSWALTARSRVLLAVDNLLDRKYLASDFGDVGLRGAPRLLSVGLRLSTR